MDLLLHLVREHEVEIHEIEIHRIVADYLGYLQQLSDLDIEAAADFVLMAATLMAIKSRSLLPTEELDLEEELDPRDELIQRLVEYRRFRTASEDLERRMLDRALQRARGFRGEIAAHREEPMLDLGDLTAFDLLAQWSRLLREVAANRPHQVRSDPRPIRFYVERLVDRLKRNRSFTIQSLVEGGEIEGPEREVLIGSFSAVLELAKLGVIHLEQEGLGADIQVELDPEGGADLDQVLASHTFEEPDPELWEQAEAAAEHELGRAAPEPYLEPESAPDSEPAPPQSDAGS
jgi:segregation and condensation protein A